MSPAQRTLASANTWKAKCPKCSQEFHKPPKNWDCPRCNVKTWQPDENAVSCECCGAPVAKFSRHHCRQCGRVTCASCTQFSAVIPEWGPEKQRVRKACAIPNEPVAIEGTLNKLAPKRAFFGEQFQSRHFQLRGTVLLYSRDKSTPSTGQIDLASAKVMDIAIYPNAFCLVGPRLQRGYVLSAESADEKRRWMEMIQKQLDIQQRIRGAAGARGEDGGFVDDDDEDDDDQATEEVLFGGAEGERDVSIQDFELCTVLGLGSFGRVMKVKEKRTGSIFAMKILDKAQIVANKMVTHTQAEKSILAEIHHPFICRLHYAFQTRKHLVLVLDFLCGGELFFHLQRNKRFSEQRARFYTAEIGLALEYIHSMNIIYRDLKPENLVLDRQGHVVLTDFGLAKRDVKDMTHTFCGTPEYMAPELIQKKGHTFAVDWWSLGVFLYEMVAGLPPFYTQNVSDMYDMILTKPLKFPPFFTADLKSLLSQLLERDPTKRMASGADFKRHAFFKGIDFEALAKREIRPEFVPDITTNDLKYFDKQFLQESTNVPQLDMPNDPNDPTSRRFEGFDFNGLAATKSPRSPVGGAGRQGSGFPADAAAGGKPKPDPHTDALL